MSPKYADGLAERNALDQYTACVPDFEDVMERQLAALDRRAEEVADRGDGFLASGGQIVEAPPLGIGYHLVILDKIEIEMAHAPPARLDKPAPSAKPAINVRCLARFGRKILFSKF